MEYVYGIAGFVVVMALLGWFQGKSQSARRAREELYTMKIRELIARLKKCDPDRNVIVAYLKYADYELTGSNLLLDLEFGKEPQA